MKVRKMLIFGARGIFLRTWQGAKINPIDANFYLQKFFDKNSADKNLIKKGQGLERAFPHAN